MGLATEILGVVVGFAGLGVCSLLRKLIIYNWPTSKLGKFLAFSPPITVQVSGTELDLLRRLVEIEERRRVNEEEDDVPGQPGLTEEELTLAAERLTGARR
ncbi:uncharacterized protein RSE6_09659 [Rhynchosporium secalis]|uniref:Uncharacterized protein n=1 Tax=Rhynchosporium secalis TaxID=38038 RepID=A0A1E1MIE3_RHYSE|nr:uncharacterized protein RSE6_09659 [Rhynchosporium secalis]